ncbi:hypothetical protein BH23CHL7_BH23CHL7_14740 [soil metagenome]
MATDRPGSSDTPPRRPRTSGEIARLPVQIALVLLGLFIGLLVLWWAWPLITGA